MNWRRDGLAQFGDWLAWLGDVEAAGVYDRASRFVSKSHYGLDSSAVADIERLDVEAPGSEANAWLSRRIGGGSVLVVFDSREVCRMDGSFFVENWQEFLYPSRDDAVILVEGTSGVLFYCHEDEFEFGQQRTV
jgi:hypothetical protein